MDPVFIKKNCSRKEALGERPAQDGNCIFVTTCHSCLSNTSSNAKPQIDGIKKSCPL